MPNLIASGRRSGSRATPNFIGCVFVCLGSCYKRQKPQALTPQAPIRNRQTRKVANAKDLNRNTNLTWPNLYELWRLRLFSFGGSGLALVVFGAIECPPFFLRLWWSIFGSRAQ